MNQVHLKNSLVLVLTLVATPVVGQIDSIEFQALNREQQELVGERFKGLHGDHWKVDAMKYSSYVRAASAPREDLELNKTEAIERARSFIDHTADLLGVDHRDLSRLSYEFLPRSSLGNVQVRSKHSLRYQNLPEIVDFGYDLDFSLTVGKSRVIAIHNRSTRIDGLPRLTSKPKVPFFDPKILDQMIGREMFYDDFAGQMQSAGIIRPEEIYPRPLTIDRTFGETLKLQAAWSTVSVSTACLGSLPLAH